MDIKNAMLWLAGMMNGMIMIMTIDLGPVKSEIKTKIPLFCSIKLHWYIGLRSIAVPKGGIEMVG